MNEIAITGMRPYDGRYPFDVNGQAFTVEEWGWIKRLADYMPLTIEKGYEGADFELYTVFAVIALHRAGVIEAKDVPAVFKRFQAVAFEDTITIEREPEATEEEAPDGPLPPSSNRSTGSSGDGSQTSSETSALPQQATGTPVLATSGLPSLTLGP